MNPTVTKSKAGWRWEIGDGRFVGVCPTKEEAEAEALRWSIVLYAEAAEQRAVAAEAEVARLRAGIVDAVAELLVWPEGAYQTPAERDVSWVRGALLAVLAEARPAGKAAEKRAEAAEAEVERLRAELARTEMAVATAYTDLPVWSESALAHLSPAERGADEVRAALGRFMRAKADRRKCAVGAQSAGEDGQ